MTKAMGNGSITINGKEVPVVHTLLQQTSLQFYPENPRIYSIVCNTATSPSQDEIETRLKTMDHVKQLVQSIRANGGLVDPLLVRDGDYVVLEGNSRLAAYRILADKEPIKWGQVKCDILPKDIPDDVVFALLGEYHIIGRKDWAPYEQAGYLWRRVKNHGVSPEQMAKDMGLSARTVKHLVAVYDFMVKHKDTDVTRWSYYDEYLKSKKIQKAREDYPEMDKVVVRKIKTKEIPRADDIRKKVKKIAQVGGKTLNTFVTTSDSLEKCYDRAVSRGARDITISCGRYE